MSLLVNPSSKLGKVVASNKCLEIYNSNYVDNITYNLNSSYDFAKTSKKTTLYYKANYVIKNVFET